jgi:antitoxin MazE
MYIPIDASMDTQIGKWGNSLAIRIPKVLADELKLEPGSRVEIQVRSGRLEIAPTPRSHELADLLDRITPGNRHDVLLDDPASGGEVW